MSLRKDLYLKEKKSTNAFDYELFPDIGDTIKGWIRLEEDFNNFEECYFDVIDSNKEDGVVVMIPNNNVLKLFPEIWNSSSDHALKMSWEAKFRIGKYEFHLSDCRIPEFEDITYMTQFGKTTIPYEFWVKMVDKEGVDWLMSYYDNSLIINFSNSEAIKAVPILYFSVDHFESIHKDNIRSKETYTIDGSVIVKNSKYNVSDMDFLSTEFNLDDDCIVIKNYARLPQDYVCIKNLVFKTLLTDKFDNPMYVFKFDNRSLIYDKCTLDYDTDAYSCYGWQSHISRIWSKALSNYSTNVCLLISKDTVSALYNDASFIEITNNTIDHMYNNSNNRILEFSFAKDIIMPRFTMNEALLAYEDIVEMAK